MVYVSCRSCEGDGDVWSDDYTRRVECPICGGSNEVLTERERMCPICDGDGLCLDCGRSILATHADADDEADDDD